MLNNPHRRNRGFTLLEMGLVLFILVVIAGMAVPMTASLVSEERLKSQAKELQDYARSARQLAVAENRPYQIVLNEKGFSLEACAVGENKNESTIQSRKLAANVQYSVQRWGGKGFGKPVEDEPWVFQPDGICEPIHVHFQSRDGWMEFAFNPLTARPGDETYYFP